MLLDYQCSHATPTERAEWAGPVPGSAPTDLAHWRATFRWLHRPTTTDPAAYRGDPDLAGMLTTTTRDKLRRRAHLLQANPLLDRGFFDDHVATLQALAATRVPGMDMLARPGR